MRSESTSGRTSGCSNVSRPPPRTSSSRRKSSRRRYDYRHTPRTRTPTLHAGDGSPNWSPNPPCWQRRRRPYCVARSLFRECASQVRKAPQVYLLCLILGSTSQCLVLGPHIASQRLVPKFASSAWSHARSLPVRGPTRVRPTRFAPSLLTPFRSTRFVGLRPFSSLAPLAPLAPLAGRP